MVCNMRQNVLKFILGDYEASYCGRSGQLFFDVQWGDKLSGKAFV